MRDADFNDLLVEECAKALWEHARDSILDPDERDLWPAWEMLALSRQRVWQESRSEYLSAARACLSRAAELTFGKIKSDIEPKITDRALKAAAAEQWRMKL